MVLRLRSCLLNLTIYAWRSLLHRSASALIMAIKELLSFVLSHCFERGLRYSMLYLLLALFCFVYLLSCTLSAQTFSAFFHVPAELFRTHTNEATTTTKATTTCCPRKIHDKIGKKTFISVLRLPNISTRPAIFRNYIGGTSGRHCDYDW